MCVTYALIDFCHDIYLYSLYINIFSLLGWPPSLLSILRTVKEQLRKETADSSAGGMVFLLLLLCKNASL